MDEDEENDLFKTVTSHDLYLIAWPTLSSLNQFGTLPPRRPTTFRFHTQLCRNLHFELLPNQLLLVAVALYTGSHLDKAAEARNISRSRSSSVRAIPREWTPEDLAKLRELKKDTKARPNSNTVAGKLARSPDDCKKRWKKLQAEDARK